MEILEGIEVRDGEAAWIKRKKEKEIMSWRRKGDKEKEKVRRRKESVGRREGED